MKRYLHILLLLLPLASPAAAAEDDVYAQISLVEGEVQTTGPDLEEWTDARLNQPFGEGDRLWVHAGKVEIHLAGGFFIRGDGTTSLDSLALSSTALQFYLGSGHVYVNNLRGGIKTAQFDTPLTSVRSYDNSVLMIDVDENGVTEVSVLKGYATAENRSGMARVSAGQTLTVGSGGSADIAPVGPVDDWERWNIARDQETPDWAESSRYLPDALQEYSPDLDRNGTWVFTNDYGYVWMPVVTISGWAPYSVGYWTWFRGNYVWISAEPWGWVPYHYGRWVYLSAFGWCWVPPGLNEVYWGPGYVGWIVTDTSVAWVPLAPGEVFYGYGFYGPHSVNLTVVNINTIVVKRSYRNISAEHGVTATDRGYFAHRDWQRRTVDVRSPDFRGSDDRHVVPPPAPERRFRHEEPARARMTRDHDPNAERGRNSEQERIVQPREDGRNNEDNRRQGAQPSLPSVRTSRPQPAQPAAPPSPVAGNENKQPPARVRQTRPDQIREQRQLQRDQGGSVFRQGRPPELNVRQQREPKVIDRKQPQQQRQQKKGDKKKDTQQEK
jgi:hypothetical protein